MTDSSGQKRASSSDRSRPVQNGPSGLDADSARPSAPVRQAARSLSNARGTILVYRDRIVPRSEVSFLGLQYLGFTRLNPVWVGCRTDDGLDALGVRPLILGRSGPLGRLDRTLFKQFGVLPPRPDLAALNPLAIHAHFGRGGALALPIARALRVPLVVTFHGGDASKEKHYRRRMVPTIYQRRLRALQKEASVIVCVSDFVRNRLIERGFPAEKLRVVRYGVAIEASAQAAPSAQPGYVLFVGRFVEKKGITHLMDALRLLEERGKSVPLVLIGDGPLAPTLRERARGLGDVRFLGWLPNRDVRGWMRGAIAVCVPSVEAQSGGTEGLRNVVIGAMAEGVPVVGSLHAGIVEAVEHGRTGLLVPAGDSRAIADAIGLLIDDPEARRTMGAMGRQRASQYFNAMDQSRLLEDLLISVCGSVHRVEAQKNPAIAS